MRFSRILLSAKAGKPKPGGNAWKDLVPVEVYPLIVAMGFAVVFATYTAGKQFSSGQLRLKRQGKLEDEHGEHSEHH